MQKIKHWKWPTLKKNNAKHVFVLGVLVVVIDGTGHIIDTTWDSENQHRVGRIIQWHRTWSILCPLFLNSMH
jgi:hypothetical protein